jgi:hypothetical protein
VRRISFEATITSESAPGGGPDRNKLLAVALRSDFDYRTPCNTDSSIIYEGGATTAFSTVANGVIRIVPAKAESAVLVFPSSDYVAVDLATGSVMSQTDNRITFNSAMDIVVYYVPSPWRVMPSIWHWPSGVTAPVVIPTAAPEGSASVFVEIFNQHGRYEAVSIPVNIAPPVPDNSSSIYIRMPSFLNVARGVPFSIQCESWLYFAGRVRPFDEGYVYNASLSLSSGSDVVSPSSFDINLDRVSSFMLYGATISGDTGVKTPNLLAVVDVNGTNFTGSMPVVIRG